jgi:hypothetical protein
MRSRIHVFDDSGEGAVRLRKEAYLGVGAVLAFTLWLSIIGSAAGGSFDRSAFAIEIAIGCLCAAAALSLDRPLPAEGAVQEARPFKRPAATDLLTQLKQDLREARQTTAVVALMLVDITRGGDMPQWARAYQVTRIERLLRLNAIANYDVFRLDNFQFALVLTHPQAINKMLDIADMLQKTSGRNRPEERMSRAYMTFGLAADADGRGTAEGLIGSAKVALQRALNLQTGPYIMLEEVVPTKG